MEARKSLNLLAKQGDFVNALNASSGFTRETRWFDGSIVIEVDMQRLWLKVYRGKVIDAMGMIPPFGATISISGSAQAWEWLCSGERMFTDLVAAGSRHLTSYDDPTSEGGGLRPPELAIGGNGFEAGRIHIGLRDLCSVFASTYGPNAP